MPALQTTYSERQPIAAAGMPADMTTYDADTGLVESADGIPFGRVVSQGTNPRGRLLGATAAALFRGISVRTPTLDPVAVDTYRLRDNIPCMFRGDIWVVVESVVVAGEPVQFSSTTGILSALPADGTHFAISGAIWITTQMTVGGLAVVRLSGHLPTQNMAS